MKIGFIHSTRLVLSLVEAAVVASERFRGADQLHIADDTLVRELVETKTIGEGIHSRVLAHARSLQERGTERIVLTCSSLSPLVDSLAGRLSVPFLKIDAPMLEEALSLASSMEGASVAIVATNPTTEVPTRLLAGETDKHLRSAGQPVASWDFFLVDGAFSALARGDKEAHDTAVVRAVEDFAARFDRVLLAQISIGRVRPGLSPDAREKTRYSLDYIDTLLDS